MRPSTSPSWLLPDPLAADLVAEVDRHLDIANRALDRGDGGAAGEALAYVLSVRDRLPAVQQHRADTLNRAWRAVVHPDPTAPLAPGTPVVTAPMASLPVAVAGETTGTASAVPSPLPPPSVEKSRPGDATPGAEESPALLGRTRRQALCSGKTLFESLKDLIPADAAVIAAVRTMCREVGELRTIDDPRARDRETVRAADHLRMLVENGRLTLFAGITAADILWAEGYLTSGSRDRLKRTMEASIPD